ncbi:MAG: hypothetical protein KBT33_01180 [Prevotellaceae bacterium]|nr:hypothetical protein [Candidatus Minthosoma equi]
MQHKAEFHQTSGFKITTIMKLHHYILFLIIMLLSACTSQMDEQLQRAEEYYIEHRAINDSINEALSRIETSPSSRQDIMKRILQATYLYQKGETEKAFDAFYALSHELNAQDGNKMTEEITPYWRAVVEDYMGFIYIVSGLASQSRSHFYKVLDYAYMMHDDKAIVNAYSHISAYHHTMGELDSALYYASKPLSYESVMDSQMVAIIYNNLAVVQSSIAQNSDNDILGTLQLSKKYSMQTRDSLVTYTLMSQAYYLQGSLDSAYLYQREVECGQHDVAKLILYKFLTDYYDQHAQTDSAYKYMKLYHHTDSVCSQDKLVEPILNIANQHDREVAEQKFEGQKAVIVIVFVIVIAIVVLGAWLLHKRKLNKVYKQLESLSLQIGHDEPCEDSEQAQEENKGIPSPQEAVTTSSKHEEEAYINSEICQRLRKKAQAGDSVKSDEWNEFELAVKTISPEFYSKFYSLRKVSDLEYRICLLIRARFAPADMATLLCKSRSSVTSVRSRLYEKVFGKKGGSREWDEFILSL